MRFFCLLALVCCISCSKSTVEDSKSYPLRHNDVATVTTSIMVSESKFIDIQFSDKSSNDAVKYLGELKDSVFLPTSWTSHLVVVGRLDPKIYMTPDKPNLLTSAPYQLFTLESWYILTPFEEVDETAPALSDGPMITISRPHLLPTHFRNPPPDLSIYEKEKK
jgi:hypothetical protein